MGLVNWLKKPTAPQVRRFYFGNQGGKVVTEISMRSNDQGVAVTLNSVSETTRVFPSVFVAAQNILLAAGHLILDKAPNAGDTLFFLEVDDQNNCLRPLATIALQRNNMMECYDVCINELNPSDMLYAKSWPIDVQAMDKSHDRLAISEIKGFALDLTLLQAHRGRQALPGTRASWATIYVTPDKQQRLGPVLDAGTAGQRLNVRVVLPNGSVESLAAAQGRTFVDDVEAWGWVCFQHSMFLKFEHESGLPGPALIAVAALEERGFRPLSASYLMQKYACEESFASYRHHPLDAEWLVPWR